MCLAPRKPPLMSQPHATCPAPCFVAHKFNYILGRVAVKIRNLSASLRVNFVQRLALFLRLMPTFLSIVCSFDVTPLTCAKCFLCKAPIRILPCYIQSFENVWLCSQTTQNESSEYFVRVKFQFPGFLGRFCICGPTPHKTWIPVAFA